MKKFLEWLIPRSSAKKKYGKFNFHLSNNTFLNPNFEVFYPFNNVLLNLKKIILFVYILNDYFVVNITQIF